jgi:uncharacterized membrane protein (DUF2068 family)
VTSPRRQSVTDNVSPPPVPRYSLGVQLIAALKLIKGVVLLIVGVGALKMLHKDVAFAVGHWIEAFRVDPHNFYAHRLLEKVSFLNAQRLKQLTAGTFFYAGLLLTEGTGLLLGKRWGRYFTIIVTSSFIPLELFEIARRITFPRMVLLLMNIAIVAYLLLDLRRNSERL